MIRYLTIAIPTQRAAAQNNTVGGALLDGAAGAIIGGAATGRAGGAVAGGIILERQRAPCSARNWSRGRAGTIGTTAAAGFVTVMAATTAYRGAIAPEPASC